MDCCLCIIYFIDTVDKAQINLVQFKWCPNIYLVYQEFNEIPDDLRDDEELRCELHQRVDDLRERLWSICDERKEQAEKERETIMMDGWVDDRVGILTNYYVTLVQGEVDRFQDTVRMLKDYYRAMEGKIPDESQSDFIRLPLVEVCK